MRGVAEGLDRSPRYQEIEGQKTAPVRIRGFQLAANIEARQGSPKFLHQGALAQGCPVQAQVMLPLGRKVGSAGFAEGANGLGSGRPCRALSSRSGTVGENMNAHLRQALEFGEKRGVFIAVSFEQLESLGGVFKLTSIPHGNDGPGAIEMFDDCFVGEKLCDVGNRV
jgi:hypothetical protein